MSDRSHLPSGRGGLKRVEKTRHVARAELCDFAQKVNVPADEIEQLLQVDETRGEFAGLHRLRRTTLPAWTLVAHGPRRYRGMARIVHSRHRVLVVDDGPLNQRLMSGLLEQLGCIVDTASSGEAALSRAAEVPYDLAFVDLHMPAMDGRETVDRLRTTLSARGLPMPLIVILTADDAPPAGDQDWFDLFVSKPVSLPLLRASLDMLAEKTNQQATLFAAQPGSDRVDDFLETTRDSLERMKQALEIGDFDAIARAAHDVKGTGTSFGFRAMSVLGATLEEDARARSRSGVERGLLELEHSLSSV